MIAELSRFHVWLGPLLLILGIIAYVYCCCYGLWLRNYASKDASNLGYPRGARRIFYERLARLELFAIIQIVLVVLGPVLVVIGIIWSIQN
jgi:hypothetical protein